jgi:hypothetical protein
MGNKAFDPHALTWDGHSSETGSRVILYHTKQSALSDKRHQIRSRKAKAKDIEIFRFDISERKFKALPEADWD